MQSIRAFFSFASLLGLATFASAGFDLSSSNNVAVYWGKYFHSNESPQPGKVSQLMLQKDKTLIIKALAHMPSSGSDTIVRVSFQASQDHKY
jgi:hypothetical protein